MDEKQLRETFDRYRSYVIHQYDLTNHRTTWFVTMNAFLFGSFGVTLSARMGLLAAVASKPEDVSTLGLSLSLSSFAVANFFMLGICMTGAFSALFAFLLIESARRPIGIIAQKWEEQLKIDTVKSEHVKAVLQSSEWLLLVGGLSRRTALWGRIATPLFPIALAVVWPTIAIGAKLVHTAGWRAYLELGLLAAPISLILINFVLHVTNVSVFKNPSYGLKLSPDREHRLLALCLGAVVLTLAVLFVVYWTRDHGDRRTSRVRSPDERSNIREWGGVSQPQGYRCAHPGDEPGDRIVSRDSDRPSRPAPNF